MMPYKYIRNGTASPHAVPVLFILFAVFGGFGERFRSNGVPP